MRLNPEHAPGETIAMAVSPSSSDQLPGAKGSMQPVSHDGSYMDR